MCSDPLVVPTQYYHLLKDADSLVDGCPHRDLARSMVAISRLLDDCSICPNCPSCAQNACAAKMLIQEVLFSCPKMKSCPVVDPRDTKKGTLASKKCPYAGVKVKEEKTGANVPGDNESEIDVYTVEKST